MRLGGTKEEDLSMSKALNCQIIVGTREMIT
jgi:hypothetical protein